ncbi:DegV family protein [Corynebacterium striatum]|uniref:DegV family protein n=1 Tax=Corynebacterium striatum TaxID=43770 RepID=UPI000C1CC794|nr:DegV family protein [Corynebacterium striatum]MBD0855538.1 fatty acid-binding protein DegV [Corynebacterium striatum]MDK7884257.1 DegV family protein [Corynebacterium striatum]PIS62816.1 fatty acid-binding protein DegV [Corynebacterium striatum]PIS63586.1 fatty acid-binding protein DegV [Corynebacterium striatum]PXY07042.1 fatty acid-binding protein DegV [Corynebacterium striatum]
MSVRIVTDSAAGLSQEIVEQLQIQVLDLHVMDTEGEQSTSGLTSLELAAAYGRQMERANDAGVVAIHLSKELSSTWSAAVTASGVFPDTVKVIDSGSAGMVMGAAAMAAAKLAQEGASLEECHAAAVDTVKRGKTWVYLNSTEDLRRSGRLSATTAMLSTALLATKPIMSIVGGKLELVGKTRTQTKAFTKLVDLIASRADGDPVFVALQHNDAEEPAERLLELLEMALPEGSSFMLEELTDVLAVHAGPGAIGVSVVFSKETPDKPHSFFAPRKPVEK